MTLDELMDYGRLLRYAWDSTKQSRWKETSQRYLANALLRNLELREDVLQGTYRVSPTIDFSLNERGHIRKIEAPVVRDRIVQKPLSMQLLIPTIRPHLIYDNYASLEGRGTSMARQRFCTMLSKFYRKHGRNGYVLLIDVSKYFENVNHDILKQILAPQLSGHQDEVIRLIHYIIDTSSKTENGLNLGSENPQIFAVEYLHRIDHHCKVVRRIKYYLRYMDDIAIFCATKEEAMQLKADIAEQLATLKLEINDKKTQIIRLSHKFVWLQTKYTLTETGRIVKQPTRTKLVRERRRLKAHRRLVSKGRMSTYEAWCAYKSWRGSIVADYNACYGALKRMDALFWQLFRIITFPIKENRLMVWNNILSNAETNDVRNTLLFNKLN